MKRSKYITATALMALAMLAIPVAVWAAPESADSISSTVVTGVPAAELPIQEVAETPANPLVSGINTVWMLLAAMLVFFMQPGFALVEAGFTRSKNTANILMKNFVDFIFGSLLFWFVGFGIMFGLGKFCGVPHFMTSSFFESNGLPDPTSLPTEGFLVSRLCSAPLPPQSSRAPWPNAPNFRHI